MILLLLVSAPAHAYAVMEAFCSGLVVADTVPSAGATDVPVDTRLALVFGDGGCEPASGWTATLADAAGTDLPLGLGPGSDEPDDTWLIELYTEEGLASETEYVLTMTPPDAGEVAELGFTTGTGTVAGLTGVPSLRVEEARWSSESDRSYSGLVTLDLAMEPTEDPDGLSVIQVKDADRERGIQSFRVPEAGAMGVTVNWMDGRRPREVCPQVRQIDGAGVATEWSEPQCASVPLCGTASGPPALALVLLGLLAAARRTVRPR
ncbi:MAG: hypothetical protein Q8P41_27370 [Pseudomonadota bacterium]|nr:hypothetical protein [Pseudomonadota bacterium]